MNEMPIYVCSKGRASKPKTADLLAAAGLNFAVAVEEQEYDEYEAIRPEYDYLQVPQNTKGVAVVRNFLQQRARLAPAQTETGWHCGWYWVLDDDIENFYTVGDGKCSKCDAATALRGAERYFSESEDIAQVSLEFQQYAWSATKEYTFNTACRAVMAIHAGRTRWLKFREELPLKSDTDFSMQVLASGYRTARITRFAFGTGKYGKGSEGGCSPFYQQPDAEKRAVETLMRLWPGVVSPVVKKDGRLDVKVNWGAVAPR